jgi:HlyD family secretion protein
MRLSIVLIVILGAGIGWLWWSQQRSMASPAWQGYAEADYVKAAPVEQGMLTKISVSRGDQISKGAPLFAQDDTHERAACATRRRDSSRRPKSSWPISKLQASRQKSRRRRPT